MLTRLAGLVAAALVAGCSGISQESDASVAPAPIDAAQVSPDAGPDASQPDAALAVDGGFAENGEVCTDRPCAPGLVCCYPCGIAGCQNTCTYPCDAGTQQGAGPCNAGCFMYP